MDKRFLQKLIQATEDLDTLIYLNTVSFEAALNRWLKDFADSLTTLVEIFSSGFEFKVSASVHSLQERKLEENNIDFLHKIQRYLDGVELAFSRKALQYVKIAKQFKKPTSISENQKIVLDGLKHIQKFKTSLAKIRRFSTRILKESRSRNLHTLRKYQKQHERLAFLSTLDFDKAISLLKEHGEI